MISEKELQHSSSSQITISLCSSMYHGCLRSEKTTYKVNPKRISPPILKLPSNEDTDRLYKSMSPEKTTAAGFHNHRNLKPINENMKLTIQMCLAGYIA